MLEVGIGSGLNLPFYSSRVQRVSGVDPSIELQRIARRRMVTGSFNVEFLLQSAEDQVPLPDASIDIAVITWTLCSIPDPSKALREIQRVLKPDGQLIFLEHGLAPGFRRRRLAGSLNPDLEAYRRWVPLELQH